jgi:hypothetical protein
MNAKPIRTRDLKAELVDSIVAAVKTKLRQSQVL